MSDGDICTRDTIAEKGADKRADSQVRVEPGEKFDRYVILYKLGKGGMGVVFAAADPVLDRKIALKVVPPTTKDSARKRLLREARAMAQLDHENVVKVLAVGEEQQHVFIAMELIDGDTLHRWLNRRRRTHEETMDVLLQAGRGLQAAHRVGLVHRDFKPDNVMVSKSGRAFVLDFGLARAVHSFSTEDRSVGQLADIPVGSDSLRDRLTRDGGIVGTPRYMAPEQMASLDCDAKADQFSFCVTAYEALYRRPPFKGSGLTEIASAIGAGELCPPPRDRDGPRHVFAALARGLSASPADRWPDLRQLLAALEGNSRHRRGLVVGAAVIGVAAVAAWAAWPAHRCEPIAHSTDEILNPASLAEIRTALENTGSVFAGDAWTELEHSLADYAAGWQATAKQLCQTTIEDSRRELARACLVEQFAAFEHAVQRWRAATPSDPFAFGLALEGLPPPSQCIDGNPQGVHVVATEDPTGAYKLLVNEGERLEEADDAAAAAAAYRRAGLLAQTRQDAGAYADTQRRLGMMEDRAGRSEEAARLLESAFFTARDADRDAAAGHAALDLAYVLLESLGRTEDARSWLGHAEGLLINEQNEVMRAKLSMTSALLAVRDRKPFDALVDLDQAIRIWERLDERRQLSNAFSHLSIIHDQLGFTHAAHHAAQRALKLGEAYYGPDNPQIADLILNAGVLRAATGDPREGLRQQQRAVSLLREADAGGVRVLIASLNVAQTRIELGQADRASTELSKLCPALAEALGSTHPYVGICERELARAQEATTTEVP